MLYIKHKANIIPNSIGTEVKIALPLKGGKTVNLEGTVIYIKVFSEDISTISPGMGIEFKELTSNDSEMLRTYITELLTKDIIREQDEPIIKKDY